MHTRIVPHNSCHYCAPGSRVLEYNNIILEYIIIVITIIINLGGLGSKLVDCHVQQAHPPTVANPRLCGATRARIPAPPQQRTRPENVHYIIYITIIITIIALYFIGRRCRNVRLLRVSSDASVDLLWTRNV